MCYYGLLCWARRARLVLIDVAKGVAAKEMCVFDDAFGRSELQDSHGAGTFQPRASRTCLINGLGAPKSLKSSHLFLAKLFMRWLLASSLQISNRKTPGNRKRRNSLKTDDGHRF